MGVHVDEARRHVCATGVEHARAGVVEIRAHFRDPSVDDEHIGRAACSPASVEHRPSTYQQSTHLVPSCDR